MDKRVLKLLQRHRISSLTTLLASGSPHSAAMHYAFSEDPLFFIILTEKGSRKLQGLNPGELSRACLVVGFSEEEWLTMQMEGEVEWVSDKKDLDQGWKIYAEKYKGMDKYKNDPESVMLKFTPTWWRYSEVKPRPSVVISSEDK